jgi:uncharacterized protein involved in cysteine biosynthesis
MISFASIFSFVFDFFSSVSLLLHFRHIFSFVASSFGASFIADYADAISAALSSVFSFLRLSLITTGCLMPLLRHVFQITPYFRCLSFMTFRFDR